MIVGTITPPDLRQDVLDHDTLVAEVYSLAEAVQQHLKAPGDATDPGDLVQRIARLEVRARDLSTDELTRWLESLREILEPAP